jgi:hypothetical protein
MQRTIAVTQKSIPLAGHPFVLIDTPGQLLDEAKRKKAIQDAVRTGVEGVINVVCFGYHEADEADQKAAIPEKGGHIARAEFLKARRQVELDLLAEWVPQMDATVTKWVLTLATKGDLWWNEYQRVKEYYEGATTPGCSGIYGASITSPPIVRGSSRSTRRRRAAASAIPTARRCW